MRGAAGACDPANTLLGLALHGLVVVAEGAIESIRQLLLQAGAFQSMTLFPTLALTHSSDGG